MRKHFLGSFLFSIFSFLVSGQTLDTNHAISDPVTISVAYDNRNLDRDFSLPFQKYQNRKSCIGVTEMNDERIITERYDTIEKFKDLIFKNGREEFSNSKNCFSIFPLLGGDIGYDAHASHQTHSYFGGIHADGVIGKCTFSINCISGNLYAPSFEDSIIKRYKVVPGLGYAYGSAATGYSYQYLDAYISYTPNNIFNFQIGKGKNFWGDGYRSLFLSDVSNSYPYFKITTTVWHIKYISLFTVMTGVGGTGGLKQDFYTKFGSFHFLSWNASKRLNFGLFEAVIWKGDKGASMRSFDPNYLDPVIFYRPVEFSLGSPDNVLVGGSFKVKVANNAQFYGQVLLDEFILHDVLAHKGWWGNKQGVQAGFKQFDLFGAKNLSFQTEIDYVRPYTYSHGEPIQNYSNYDQPLADPEGANFIESASFLTYFHKNLILQGNLMIYHYGADTGSKDFGQDIFIAYNNHYKEYGNTMAQGVPVYIAIAGLRAVYIISPKMNLKAEFTLSERVEKKGAAINSYPYISIGIKTSLGNLYNDF